MESIIYQNIHFSYPKTVNSDFKLNIPKIKLIPGKITLIAGGNGSGKTTLLRILSADITPKELNITFDSGNKITSKALSEMSLLTPVSRDIFFPQLSSFENAIYLSNLFNKNSFTNSITDGDFQSLSQGNKAIQIYKFVTSLDKSIIFLDEPTNGLDQENTQLLLTMLEMLKSQNKIIVMAMPEAHSIIVPDILIKLKAGSIQ